MRHFVLLFVAEHCSDGRLARERDKSENPEPDADQKFQDLCNVMNGLRYFMQLCTKSFLADTVRCCCYVALSTCTNTIESSEERVISSGVPQGGRGHSQRPQPRHGRQQPMDHSAAGLSCAFGQSVLNCAWSAFCDRSVLTRGWRPRGQRAHDAHSTGAQHVHLPRPAHWRRFVWYVCLPCCDS